MNGRWLMSLLLASMAATASPTVYKVEKTGTCASSEISDAVRGTLQNEGMRVSGDSGPLCDVWLRKVLPMKAGSTKPEYGTLNSGDFVGVIVYSKGAGDYKGQGIKPGAYTMRYQTMPADGNHMGVSPTQEYVLLVPASLDKDPGATVEYAQLLYLSRKVAASSHPVPLYLTAPTAGGNPSFQDTGDGRWALEMKTKGQPAGGGEIDFPLALVLIGKGEG